MTSIDAFIDLMKKGEQLSLKVSSGDEVAEVLLLDSSYRLLSKTSGKEVQFEVEPGVYIVRVRAGSNTKSKTVVVSGNTSVSFDPIAFSTPIPLDNTSKTHESHVASAVNHSSRVSKALGVGSQLYVFSRVWTGKEESATSTLLQRDLCTGLSLRNTQGVLLADFGSPDLGNFTQGFDPWSATNLELDSGCYLLCLETASGQSMRQTVVTCQGWQTQIFLLQKDYGNSSAQDIRVDLENGSIYMSRIQSGFLPGSVSNPDAADARLTELARQGLTNNRNVIRDEFIRKMANSKFENPMFGLYSANLLLSQKSYDNTLLSTIVTNLRNILPTHPDVEALALKLGMGSSHVFDTPPMLRHSWNYVLEAALTNENVVPENSLAASIAGRYWSSPLWLLWTDAGSQHDDDEFLLQQLSQLASQQDVEFGNSRSFEMNIAPKNASLSNFITADYLKQAATTLGIPRVKVESLLKK